MRYNTILAKILIPPSVIFGFIITSVTAQESDASEIPATTAADAPPPLGLTPDQQTHINKLIRDLHDDDIRANALDALDDLHDFGPLAIPALETALFSDDWQQRQLAAHLLRRIDRYQPTRRMLEVCVEGLRCDGLPYGHNKRTGREYCLVVANARSGIAYLQQHTTEAEDFISQALDSDDHQQQFMAACLAGYGNLRNVLHRAAPILIAHLFDNNIPGDANMAAPSLYRYGNAIRPYLKAALPQADRQARQLINLILLDLDSPPITRQDFYHRAEMQQITEINWDPVFEVDRLGNSIRWGNKLCTTAALSPKPSEIILPDIKTGITH